MLIGASINESNGTLTWHQFSLEEDKLGNQIGYKITIQPKHFIDFPIMCSVQ